MKTKQIPESNLSTKNPALLTVCFLATIFAVTLFIISCKKNVNGPGHTDPSTLLQWNDAATQAVSIAGLGPDGPLPPMPESRIYAMVNVAMHDALNNIVTVNKTYAISNTPDKDADPNTAMAQAAHDVIIALLPPAKTYADSLYTSTINTIADGTAKTKGISIGKAAAAAILANRAGDGADAAQTPYTAGTLPGQYRATPPFDAAPFNGFVSLPGWGKLKPFGLASDSQFRVAAPYAVVGSDYAADLNEIQTLGAATNSARTADQTQIGLFWLENIPHSFNRIARNLIVQRNLDAWAAARLLAILHLAMADANISSFDGKFYYNFWRPITAVRLADGDGNPNTNGNPTWDALGAPTPPVPDYPSNHALNGSAGAAVLKDFFGTDNISFTATSTSLPNVSRQYTSFSQAAHENALSRIYAGFHFRNAVITGEGMGYKVGDYVYAHVLQPL